MPTDGFGVIVISFADEPQSIRGQQPTIVSVAAQLLIISNLPLSECLFHNCPPNKNKRAVPAFRLHRKSSFYTATGYFLIIPRFCIKLSMIISRKRLSIRSVFCFTRSRIAFTSRSAVKTSPCSSHVVWILFVVALNHPF